ncbi:hypothetical protein ACC691_38115, partial [Rhizobium johnstonii]|uniref:hypothetical protein n=1 Tax=Rhizobium johnstonii TaxID=3019933 RepID=UPI003F9DFFB9
APAAVAEAQRTAGVQSAGSTATIVREPQAAALSVAYGRSPSLRVGFALTVIAWVLHLAADVMRGIAAGRVPWANMYESRDERAEEAQVDLDVHDEVDR